MTTSDTGPVNGYQHSRGTYPEEGGLRSEVKWVVRNFVEAGIERDLKNDVFGSRDGVRIEGSVTNDDDVTTGSVKSSLTTTVEDGSGPSVRWFRVRGKGVGLLEGLRWVTLDFSDG